MCASFVSGRDAANGTHASNDGRCPASLFVPGRPAKIPFSVENDFKFKDVPGL